MATKRKWKKGEHMKVCGIGDLVNCINVRGGVWWDATKGKFMNRAWVESQQLHTLLLQLKLGRFFYPERISYGK